MGLTDIDLYDRGLARAFATGSVTFEIVSDGPDPAAPYYTDAWRQLFTSRDHSPRHWARLTSAVHNADHVQADLVQTSPAHDSAQRGGEQWCAQAYQTYQHLRAAGAYAYLPEHTDRCVGDPTVIRTWLDAPALRGPAGSTVADALDLGGRFDGSGHVAAAAVENVLWAAQSVGVFGLPDHRVELHLRDALDSPPLALVTRPERVDPTDADNAPPGAEAPNARLHPGPGVVSDPLYLFDLTNPHGIGTTSAVVLLTTAAIYVNQSLHPADVDTDRTRGQHRNDTDLGARPRAFPPLTVGTTVVAAQQPTRPDGRPQPGRHR